MNSTEPDQNLATPGSQLLKTRKQNAISVETIAQRMRLDVEHIRALENDEYEKFPAVAYVRGYLRTYANLVGLDSDQLINLFDQNAISAPPLAPFVSQPQPQAGSGDKHIRAVTYSLIAALVLLLALWWQAHRSSSETFTDQNDEIVIQVETESDEFSESLIPEDGGALPLAKNSQKTTPMQEIPEELEHESAVVQFSELPRPPEENLEEVSPVNISGLEISDEEPEMLGDSNLSQELSSITSVDDEIQIENKGIVLQFTDESWVEITDASGKKRYSKVGQTGDVDNITGETPFRIVIGKASGVLLSFQGEFIDLEPLTKNEVARFTIDNNGAHR